MNEIYRKIQICRNAIKDTKIEKKGWNEYSKYKYFLPEQIHVLVHEETIKENLFCKFDLDKNEFGLFAKLTVIDLETDKEVVFKMITDIPVIKATNIAQQLGGTVTYSNRYLLMTVFDIQDNTSDFDTPQKKNNNQEKEPPTFNEDKKEPEQWLNKYDKDKNILTRYTELLNNAKENNKTVKDLRKHYKISKAVAEEIEFDLKN